ncbi:MAG: XdhC/CoxI family protein [Vicingaceae bacterium]|nr:XdhC/CoxI family protein [Vicingaceae bacterium]
MNIYNKIEQLRTSGIDVALCTIIHTKGSTPRKVGAKMLVFADGTIKGTIGGGNLEKDVIKNALIQLKNNEPKLFKHDLLHQHNMCCGGIVEIFIEPIEKMKKLYIFGAGHTGQALAKYALTMDFEIFVIDDRKEYINQLKEVSAINKLHVDYKKALPTLPFDENTFVVILTYEHEIDRDILSYCIKKPHAYLGMIGSQRKIEMTKKMFLDAGIATKKQLEKVNMPIGKNILAETPEEIAISILAELIEVKNKPLQTSPKGRLT